MCTQLFWPACRLFFPCRCCQHCHQVVNTSDSIHILSVVFSQLFASHRFCLPAFVFRQWCFHSCLHPILVVYQHLYSVSGVFTAVCIPSVLSTSCCIPSVVFSQLFALHHCLSMLSMPYARFFNKYTQTLFTLNSCFLVCCLNITFLGGIGFRVLLTWS